MPGQRVQARLRGAAGRCGRFQESQAPSVVAGILRAIGVKPEETKIIAMRVGASDRMRVEPPPSGG